MLASWRLIWWPQGGGHPVTFKDVTVPSKQGLCNLFDQAFLP